LRPSSAQVSLYGTPETKVPEVNRLFPNPYRHFFGKARASINLNDRGTIVSEEKGNPNIDLIDRRRAERRILVNVPVEVTEINGEGRHITERTFIEDVSDFGCRFSTRGQVQQGDTVSVKPIGPNGRALPGEEPHLYEIMWVARKEHSSTVGARLLQGEKLANIKFPQKNGGQKYDPK
jgi:hypothetical protein